MKRLAVILLVVILILVCSFIVFSQTYSFAGQSCGGGIDGGKSCAPWLVCEKSQQGMFNVIDDPGKCKPKETYDIVH